MSLNTTLMLTAVTSFLCASQALANDTSLYAEPAPVDASFVRFIGFDSATTAEFAGKNFALSAGDNSAYVPVSSAQLQNTSAGSYVTVLRNKDGEQDVIVEGPRDTRSKVFLFLVNGTDTPLDLRLADGSATVIDAVAAGMAGQRGVNPLAVTLGVFTDGTDTALATFDVTLKRGQNLSFVANKNGVRMIENRFAAVAK